MEKNYEMLITFDKKNLRENLENSQITRYTKYHIAMATDKRREFYPCKSHHFRYLIKNKNISDKNYPIFM